MSDSLGSNMLELLKALANPTTTLGDILDFAGGWFGSRRWGSLALFALPGFVVVVFAATMVIIGKSQGKDVLLARYAELAEKEAPLNSDSLAQGNEEKKESEVAVEKEKSNEVKTDKALLYFRRVLQLENDNKRARYYVASRYAIRGSLAQARKMMEQLAPSKEAGYLPAHAWMAVDLIQQKQKGLKVSDTKLNHHLDKMSQWPEVSPQLLLVYAQFLASRQEKDAAVSMCQLAARKDQKLANQAAMLVKAIGNNGAAEQLASNAVLYHQAKLKAEEDSEEHRMGEAQGYILLEQWEQATNVLAEGLKINPESPSIRRSLSMVLVERFKKSIVDEKDKFEANWGFLQSALSVDPFNPAIGEQIAEMMQKEVTLDENFLFALRKQLAEGKASTITHMLLANAAVREGKFEQGRQHLATAYGLAPYATVVLNNYAMILTMVDPPELNKARELIDEAVKRDPTNAETLDSRGRILLMLNDVSNAIASFEKALAIAPERLDTRRVLVDAYDKNGLPEMAEAQRQVLKEKMEAKKE